MKAYKKQLNGLKRHQDAPIKELLKTTAIFVVDGILLSAGVDREQ